MHRVCLLNFSFDKSRDQYVLALYGCEFAFVRTVEKFSVEELDRNDGEDKLK